MATEDVAALSMCVCKCSCSAQSWKSMQFMTAIEVLWTTEGKERGS